MKLWVVKDWTQESDKTVEDDKEEINDTTPIAPLEGDEKEVKEGKGRKILTPNKLLAGLLAQIKAGNIFTKTKKRNQTNTASTQ